MQKNTFSTVGILLTLVSLIGFSGCSTDLDINAPYREFTVIYAAFDQNETTHLVKINKSFLGEGNALDFAQVQDSSEYSQDELEVFVHRIENGNITATYTLNDTVLTDRVPGTFYYPEQTLYTFNAVIDENAEYEVEARVRDEVFRGRTNIVNSFSIDQSTSNPNVRLSFYNQNSSTYQPDEIEWDSGLNGKRYVVSYRFKWREVIGADTTDKSFTRTVGQRIATNTGGGQALQAVVNGLDFYTSIGNLIPEDPAVDVRIFDFVDIIWEVANEDLHIFLQLNEPVTGIVENRPPFTNVDNEGLGIVVSRLTQVVEDKTLREESLLELVTGQFTGNLKFCSPEKPGDPTLGCPP